MFTNISKIIIDYSIGLFNDLRRIFNKIVQFFHKDFLLKFHPLVIEVCDFSLESSHF